LGVHRGIQDIELSSAMYNKLKNNELHY